MSNKISRGDFLKRSGLAAAGVMMGGLATTATAANAPQPQQEDKKARFAKLGKVNIAWIGMANRGREVMREFEKTGLANIVAMCDVDPKSKGSQESIAAHPDAKVYTDFRKMFDEMGNQFEAVVVETPDFSHFPCVMLALNQGKHVYVETATLAALSDLYVACVPADGDFPLCPHGRHYDRVHRVQPHQRHPGE